MAATAQSQSAMLQSKDHGELLDVIDQLRSLGIDHHVPLPQIVVCGDQSSGKSSVLEAVSGVHFPTKDTLCTRFATELILRRDSVANVKVSIRPGEDRSDLEKQKLGTFKAPTQNIDDLPVLVEAAKDAMGINSELKAFSEDILRIEISGPGKPHLTLVDLPGLFHAPSKQQSAGDAALVKSLVRSYMANERSIILAVVSAKNDYANQVVTGLAREIDPKGYRTLGIITKPDTLIVGSDSERSFVNLAKNEDVSFRLGWHVLMNRDFNTKDSSEEERNEREKDLFTQGVWTALPANILGIGPLIPRLSNVLKDQITSVLPSLIDDVRSGISECEATLSRLGASRESAHEQRSYLIRISRDFSSLMKAAVDGVYADEYFGDALTYSGYNKRTRAVVQNLLLEFAQDMRDNGQNKVIVDGEITAKMSRASPEKISRWTYLEEVRKLMTRSRGRELPGTFNPLIVGDLFFQQSQPWKRIVDGYNERLLNAVRTSVELALAASADEATSDGLLQEVLLPAMEKFSASLQKKVAEIMLPHQHGHPITYNHYFTETIQKARRAHQEKELARLVNVFFNLEPEDGPSQVKPSGGFNTGDLLKSLTSRSTEEDMDRHACSEAVDCMEAYYKVAMKVIVDNYSVLAIEACILKELSNIFSPSTVMEFDDELIGRIAAETEVSLAVRRGAIEKMKTLHTGLQVLSRLSRRSAKTNVAGPATTISDSDEASVTDSIESEVRFEIRQEGRKSPVTTEETEEAFAQPQLVAMRPYPEEAPVVREEPSIPMQVPSDETWLNGSHEFFSKKTKKKGKKQRTDGNVEASPTTLEVG